VLGPPTPQRPPDDRRRFRLTLSSEETSHAEPRKRAAHDPIFLKAAGQALHLHGLRALLGVAKAMFTRRVA